MTLNANLSTNGRMTMKTLFGAALVAVLVFGSPASASATNLSGPWTIETLEGGGKRFACKNSKLVKEIGSHKEACKAMFSAFPTQAGIREGYQGARGCALIMTPLEHELLQSSGKLTVVENCANRYLMVHYETGATAMVVEMDKGRASGELHFYHPNGARAGGGTYESFGWGAISAWGRVGQWNLSFADGRPFAERTYNTEAGKECGPAPVSQELKAVIPGFNSGLRVCKGARTGTWKTYYPSGQVNTIRHFEPMLNYHSLPQGTWAEFREDGSKVSEAVFSYPGVCLGRDDSRLERRCDPSLRFTQAYTEFNAQGEWTRHTETIHDKRKHGYSAHRDVLSTTFGVFAPIGTWKERVFDSAKKEIYSVEYTPTWSKKNKRNMAVATCTGDADRCRQIRLVHPPEGFAARTQLQSRSLEALFTKNVADRAYTCSDGAIADANAWAAKWSDKDASNAVGPCPGYQCIAEMTSFLGVPDHPSQCESERFPATKYRTAGWFSLKSDLRMHCDVILNSTISRCLGDALGMSLTKKKVPEQNDNGEACKLCQQAWKRQCVLHRATDEFCEQIVSSNCAFTCP